MSNLAVVYVVRGKRFLRFQFRFLVSGRKTKKRGVLAKGVSVESIVTAKETKSAQGYWAQQYIWHSERHSQERRTFCKNPLQQKKNLLLVPELCGFHI